MRYSATSIEAPGEIFHSAVEPIRYPVSNFGGLFWDPPSSYFANNAARMVPMPLYTQTPPRLTPTTPIAPKHRASLLPYPDLFDFSMYHSRVSKGSTVDLSFEGLLPDFTSAFDKPHHAKIPGDTVQSRYYERNPEPELFSRVNSRTSFSSCEFEIQDHDLPMHPKSLSLSLSTEDLAKTWGRPTYSSDILDHRSFLSSDDISIRLRIACGDLSQCVWTEEEFLQIIS
ncbi:hypothetical protein H0H81_000726 [Sphagnurus paluster]|uniref:Uncharacterized protein n=1 Tax=Sphagnurus paluster TaxID=117069 RepID=A0A9P7K605_9AGAR|nr:hypothetical protein H0H81_000726 [Sphagnurus paluster]